MKSRPCSSSRPIFALRGLRARSALGVLLGALMSTVACGSGLGPLGKSARPGKCFAPPSQAPEFEPLSAVKLPRSRIWVRAAVPVKDVVERIQKEVPATLANEKDRDIGAPGYATYRVTRKTPVIKQTETGFSVSVPINADISVCKKIGPACIRYGSCNPAFDASFSLNPTLGDDWEITPPRGSIAATKKCVIGVDVTGEIEKIAKKELQGVQAQIEREWPKLRPQAKRGYQELKHSIALSNDNCVHFVPERTPYRKVSIEKVGEEEQVVAGLGLVGHVLPAASCDDKRKLPPLPTPKSVKTIPEKSRIWFPEVLSLETVQTSLKESAKKAAGEGESLVVTEVLLEKKKVALHLESSGSVCGKFWVTGALSHEKGSEKLTVSRLAVVGNLAEPDRVRPLLERLMASLAVPLSSAGWFTEDRLSPLKAALRAAVPPEVLFTVADLTAEDARVLSAEDGVYVLHPVSADLVITDF